MSEVDTKTRILDAAQDLIQRLGANGMSYQHISDAVGIRKASIHYHFPAKEDLIEALLDRYHDYFLKLVDQIIATEDSAKQRMKQYVALFEATLLAGKKDKACLFGMLGAELASLGDDSAARVRYFYEENEKRLTKILEDGRKGKEFYFEGNSRATATLIFSLLEGAVLVARAQGGVRQFRVVGQQLMSLLNS